MGRGEKLGPFSAKAPTDKKASKIAFCPSFEAHLMAADVTNAPTVCPKLKIVKMLSTLLSVNQHCARCEDYNG
jgi:hypothetical protein